MLDSVLASRAHSWYCSI